MSEHLVPTIKSYELCKCFFETNKPMGLDQPLGRIMSDNNLVKKKKDEVQCGVGLRRLKLER